MNIANCLSYCAKAKQKTARPSETRRFPTGIRTPVLSGRWGSNLCLSHPMPTMGPVGKVVR